MDQFSKILGENSAFIRRHTATTQKIKNLRERFKESDGKFYDTSTCAYCVGSLARGEVGKHSDLDLFLLTSRPYGSQSYLDDIELLSSVIEINRGLEYASISNDGQFLKVYSLDNMTEVLGAPQDDSENLFTARMLLLLESRAVCNESIYNAAMKGVINHYFRDSRGKRSFRPLFLLNDILRYWRTICLNYELIRDDQDKPWRKKNINLKFSRMITVFGTVLPVISEPMSRAEQLIELVSLSPHERFAHGLDIIGDISLSNKYKVFLNDYESFICWKERMGSDKELSDNELDESSRAAAKRVSDFMYLVLSHCKIDGDLRKYLVL